MHSMSETAGQEKSTANSQATTPGGETAPGGEDVTGGEKALAVLAACFGAFLILMAVDMFTGGRLTGMIGEAGG
jgi:hypothetical protein